MHIVTHCGKRGKSEPTLAVENLLQRVTHRKAYPGCCSGANHRNLNVKGRSRRTLRDQKANTENVASKDVKKVLRLIDLTDSDGINVI